MTETTPPGPSKETVKVTRARVDGIEDLHFTAVPRHPEADTLAQTRSLYGAVLEHLDDPASLRIVTERVYGKLAVKEAFLSARADVLLEAGVPADGCVTYLEGAPVEGEALAGVHLTFVRPGDARVQAIPVCDGGHACGFSLTSGTLHRVFLSSVHGLKSGEVGASAADQARRMFERADSLLGTVGLTYNHVVLTRIHLRRLLDWYDDFNAVRNPFYRKLGLLKDDAPSAVPASTGIQGKMSDDCECVMDVTAVSSGPDGTCPVAKLHNPLQDEATDYGSAFARGVRVTLPGVDYVLISGTASIDETGATVHLDDPLGQVRRTMANFESILKAGGASPAHLYHAIWYCKDPSFAAIVRREMQEQGWPTLPWVVARADVCRHDLLVEVDGSALVTTG